MTAQELTIEPSGDPQAPDPEGVAAEILAAEPAAPRKSGKKRGRPRKVAAEPEAEAVPVNAPITAEEITAVGGFTGMLWKLSPLKPLELEEQDALARATIPVLRKYLPKLGGFEAEAMLALTLVGLIASHLPPPKPKPVEVVPSSEAESPLWRDGR